MVGPSVTRRPPSTPTPTDDDGPPDQPSTTDPPGGDPTDRAFHLARVCAGFTTTISRRSADRLARLLSPPDTATDDGRDGPHAA
ncbi:hypothetical protein E0F15_07085 [Frankia sp. B2]|uniref:hypothetical protein n=1 Tax=Frankia TaxID=1854 RepID=UPI0003CFEDAB|nr:MULTISPECIES: hypothetical protein [Frankia]ETA03422.1 hypothetical protein CcI6DRAFT_01138 [Frankia sp. CcI6]TFE32846.1 hypothetical protein E0F15_07085 [Frankia sp. B2]